MNNSMKRTRQLTLFESFKSCKQPNRDQRSMEDKDKREKRELLASAAEKRIAVTASGNVESLESGIEFNDSEDTLLDSQCSPCGDSEDLFPESYSEENLPDSQNSLLGLSEDLFPEYEPYEEQDSEETASSKSSEPILLNRLPDCGAPLPTLNPSSNHEIMFRPHIMDGLAPRPYPDVYRDSWDTHHVRMPCSEHNLYPVFTQEGEKVIQNRWDLIKESLSVSITSSTELEVAIMKYNRQYSGRWDFRGLHTFFYKCLKTTQRAFFFDSILPGIIRLALDLPNICTQSIPLLSKHKDHKISLTQKQIGSLLANAFLCTFPRRNLPSRHSSAFSRSNEYYSYPDINFNRLFVGQKDKISPRNVEKLKCIINYFLRITTKEPTGVVTFHRKCFQQMPKWECSDLLVRPVIIRSPGFIESEGHGMLQVDFANKFVGGGVLGQGCVQEEIRFVICPELIVSRLFTECLDENEVLVITGVEQYNAYEGYADTFTWEGDFTDRTASDSWGRKYINIVAIDALHFRNSSDQYKIAAIRRELNKAYVGFSDQDVSEVNLPAVATGNWGCGAFKGNPHLKFLIQLMATTESRRGMLYFTFGNRTFCSDFEKMFDFIRDKNLTVGDIFKLLEKYSAKVAILGEQSQSLFDFIYQTHNTNGGTTRNRDNNEPVIPSSIFERDIAAAKDWPSFFD